MGFSFKAKCVAFGSAVGIVGVSYLFGDHHPPILCLGFFIALTVFVAGVEHLSEKADKITEAIESMEARLQDNGSEEN